jgi:hypothetical protein
MTTLEATPIYTETLRALAGQEGRDIVRRGLIPCPRCSAIGAEPCHQPNGKRTRDHRVRA